jgi:hypothetical protein
MPAISETANNLAMAMMNLLIGSFGCFCFFGVVKKVHRCRTKKPAPLQAFLRQ